ncbi:hypothetical protein [Halobacillus sp. B29]|uniref:hypothetical protein n=1 Tax=Halobacillus sp. B29 TaxID=3457432 RepID=UPI003FCECF6E
MRERGSLHRYSDVYRRVEGGLPVSLKKEVVHLNAGNKEQVGRLKQKRAGIQEGTP